MMTTSQEWEEFLQRWSAELAKVYPDLTDEVRANPSLSFDAATDRQIEELEKPK
jgi:hypothetical protein